MENMLDWYEEARGRKGKWVERFAAAHEAFVDAERRIDSIVDDPPLPGVPDQAVIEDLRFKVSYLQDRLKLAQNPPPSNNPPLVNVATGVVNAWVRSGLKDYISNRNGSLFRNLELLEKIIREAK